VCYLLILPSRQAGKRSIGGRKYSLSSCHSILAWVGGWFSCETFPVILPLVVPQTYLPTAMAMDRYVGKRKVSAGAWLAHFRQLLLKWLDEDFFGHILYFLTTLMIALCEFVAARLVPVLFGQPIKIVESMLTWTAIVLLFLAGVTIVSAAVGRLIVAIIKQTLDISQMVKRRGHTPHAKGTTIPPIKQITPPSRQA